MKQDNLQIAHELFQHFLEEKGLSFTRQRKFIVEQVIKDQNHFKADDVVEALQNGSSKVSRATVYRTLSYLEECGIIRRVDLGTGYSHFEHTLGHSHHEHLYCRKCGKIIEFFDADLEERLNTIANANHFRAATHAVLIFGVCQQCTE